MTSNNKNDNYEQHTHNERERERERVINVCNSCRTTIPENEVAYAFDKIADKSKKIERPSSWVKCEGCYNQFQLKVEEYHASVSRWWKWGSIGNGVLSMIIGFFTRNFFREEQRYRGENERFGEVYSRGEFKWKLAGFLLGSVGCFVIVSLIIWIIRLIWRPYRSTVEKLVYKKEETKEV